MKRKYFFFDIDGTLGLKLTMKMPADMSYTIKQLMRRGHFVAMATGRGQADAARVAEKYGIPSFVADGGNSLTWNGKLLKIEPLPLEKSKSVLHALENNGIPWAVITDNSIVLRTTYAYFRNPAYSAFTQYSGQISKDGTIDGIRSVFKIFFTRPPEEKMPDLGGLPLIPYLNDLVLIEPVHKEKGIKDLMGILKAPLEDVVVFGDGMNDISMFTEPFFRIAMGNGREELKKIADYVTDRNDAGGIFRACLKFGWLQ